MQEMKNVTIETMSDGAAWKQVAIERIKGYLLSRTEQPAIPGTVSIIA